jgi:hypothetical protein
MRSAIKRRVMGASDIHGCVGAFYAPHPPKGKHILQIPVSRSVSSVRGSTIRFHARQPVALAWAAECGPTQPAAGRSAGARPWELRAHVA